MICLQSGVCPTPSPVDRMTLHSLAVGKYVVLYFKRLCLFIIYQIHLHHQGEVAQMKDQGFAVAPGSHTLVAVKRVQVGTIVSIVLSVDMSRKYFKIRVMSLGFLSRL